LCSVHGATGAQVPDRSLQIHKDWTSLKSHALKNALKHLLKLFECLILISIDFLRSYFSVFSLVLVSIEAIYQTLKTVFDHISKHLEIRQKYSAARRIFIFRNGVKQIHMKQSFFRLR